MARCIILDPTDDVAVALEPVGACEKVVLSNGQEIIALSAIPFGHKVALRDLGPGGPVHKYGEVIGAAIRAIRAGEHVHVHNIKSLRV